MNNCEEYNNSFIDHYLHTVHHTCSVPHCGKQIYQQGRCPVHYAEYLKSEQWPVEH